MKHKMKNKKSEGIPGWWTIILLAIVIVIGLILLGLTGKLGEIGRNILKGIKYVLPFV